MPRNLDRKHKKCVCGTNSILQKYLIQPAVTVTDAILCAAYDLTQVLKGRLVVKGETRVDVDLLMNVSKTVGNTK